MKGRKRASIVSRGDNAYTTQFPPLYHLGDHKDHAAELGRLVTYSSGVEFYLCHLMAALLEAPMWRSQAAYYSIFNQNTRLDIIRELTHGMQGEAEYRGRVIDLCNRARTMADKRNALVHKPWLIDGGNAYILESLWEYPIGKKRKVHASEILEASKAIRAFSNDLVAFLNEYSKKYPHEVSRDRIPKKLLPRSAKQSPGQTSSGDH